MASMAVRKVLTASAVAEALTGLVLTVAPALLLTLLFSRADDWGPRLPAARVAGIALIALGLACRPDGNDDTGRTPAVHAMLVYNGLIAAYFVYFAAVGMAGVLLWPALVAHAVVTVLLFLGWQRAGPESSRASRATDAGR
jgi:predicted small integral membrane protein